MIDWLEVNEVNKFNDSEWPPETLFEPFKYRYFFKEENNWIKAVNRTKQLKTWFCDEIGIEGVDWIFRRGHSEGELDEVFVRNNRFFLTWKMRDHDNFKDWVVRMDWHKEETK